MAKRKTPEEYRPTLRKRDEIAAWLLSTHNGWRQRGGYNYDNEDWLFCFDVKLGGIDLGFDRMLRTYRETVGGTRAFDPVWVEGCRRLYAEDNNLTERLLEGAIVQCRATFVGHDGNGRPDDDGWNALCDGTPIQARFAFMGRSGGYLVLREFQGYTLTYADVVTYREDTPCNPSGLRMSYGTLHQLYRYLLMLRHDASNRAVRNEVTFQAAYVFFEVFCDEVESPEILRADRAHQEKLRIKFLDDLIARAGVRSIGGIVPAKADAATAPDARVRRRRIDYCPPTKDD